MYHRIMELLVLIMDEFSDSNWKAEEMDQVSENLIERGYTEQEINTAFYWLYYRFDLQGGTPAQKVEIEEAAETSHRVLHNMERRYIEPEAFGYLLQLKHLKIISQREIEEIIERLFILDFQPATVEDVKSMVQSFIFEEGVSLPGILRSFEAPQKGETYH